MPISVDRVAHRRISRPSDVNDESTNRTRAGLRLGAHQKTDHHDLMACLKQDFRDRASWCDGSDAVVPCGVA